ncbi:Toprim_4 domain-containing protein [Cephalotus follicularis]|uniref:Toprim_4 domain-containing protein n=1 Tax=Cephalotus follicularis TaxID=3775 RepID=A0A1Q3BCS3_CEPFO|nr:Toprim_4 domain-containing protein [Cephalotus follicularis]
MTLLMRMSMIQQTQLLLMLGNSSKWKVTIVPKRVESSLSTISHSQVDISTTAASGADVGKLRELKERLELLGINADHHHSYTPGLHSLLFCPRCKGGQSFGRSLSFHIIQNGDFAVWRCFHATCGWAGQAFADSNKMSKVQSSRPLTEEGLGLQPLGHELIAYFGERMISEETLHRNGVMQKCGVQPVIAFTYRQNGVIVGCKYRTLEKRYWQEKGTEKWLYGVDDMREAAEIIIVEGEIDKLSLEEAGFLNCTSVPNGAPQKVSKVLPAVEKDNACQYIWNCKQYLDKVSRIILATDGDQPGDALAEELARRLGKERCWRVRWPQKDDSGCFKDANEVLKCLGPGALNNVIQTAELYPLHFSSNKIM